MRRPRSEKDIEGIARCGYCKKTIPAGVTALSSPDGFLFDSTRCRERYLRNAPLRAFANALRVARSRLKARTILRAEAVYRKLGGRGWPKVKVLLRAVL
jgi:hypothetical protein